MNTTDDDPQDTPDPNRLLPPLVFAVRTSTITTPADEASDRWELVTVLGEVDMDSASELVDAIGDVAGNAVVDLSGVTFMDSVAIRGLVRAQQTARQRGQQMILRNPSMLVRRVLEVTSLIDSFTVEDEGDNPPR
jgi:anti-anti-sigma factor